MQIVEKGSEFARLVGGPGHIPKDFFGTLPYTATTHKDWVSQRKVCARVCAYECVCMCVRTCTPVCAYLGVLERFRVCQRARTVVYMLCTVVLAPSWLTHMQMSMCSAHANMHAFPDTALLVTARGEFLSVYCTWYSVSTCCHDDPFCTTEGGPTEVETSCRSGNSSSCALCTLFVIPYEIMTLYSFITCHACMQCH